MAVMEAIYLSDRTGQPERPANLLGTRNLKVEDCMQATPPEQEPEQELEPDDDNQDESNGVDEE
jgi:hypothetical protein